MKETTKVLNHSKPNTGQVIAYRRVSTASQKTTRQLAGLETDREFTDKVSGGQSKRPALDALLQHIRAGDTVHVHSIDRLARDLRELLW